MKLPWDKNYLKISLHVVATLLAGYVLYLAVSFIKYLLTDLGTVIGNIGGFIGGILKVFSVLIFAFIIAYMFDPMVDACDKTYREFHGKHLMPFINNKVKPFFIKTLRTFLKDIHIRLEKNKYIKGFLTALRNLNIFKIFLTALRKLNIPKLKMPVRERKKPKDPAFQRRTAGTIIVYIIVLTLIISVIADIFVRIGAGSRNTSGMDDMVVLINKTVADLTDWYGVVRDTLEGLHVADFMSDVISELITVLTNATKNVSNNLLSMLSTAGTTITDIALAFFVAFYMLRDKTKLMNTINMLSTNFLPQKFGARSRIFMSDVHAVFSGYLRGHLVNALIVGTLISVSLSIIGVDFAVIIGIVSGFAQIIPYFGAILGFVIAVAVALLSGEPMKALYAAIAIIIIQQTDSLFLTPRVMGKQVELSPALVVLSLSVGGALFGIAGMIFAVPVFAIIKIIAVRYVNRKLEAKKGGGKSKND